MNRFADAVIGCALIAGVTIAAIHFNNPDWLWLYLMVLFI
jgi:hypothetical protein